MPHKLKIKMILNPFIEMTEEGKNFFKERLTNHDVIRGQPCEITFEITNIGEKPFPGGGFEDIYYFHDDISLTIAPREIPPVGVKETKTIKRRIVPMNNGGGSIRVGLKSKDGEVIEAYQHRLDKPIGKNEWQNIFYVIPYESANLLWFLAQILDRVKK